MDIAQARRIGGKKAALGFLWMLLLFEGMGFFFGMQHELDMEDFVELNKDQLFECLVVLLFLLVFIMGRMAGKRILVDRKNHMLTAMLFWVITTLICVICFAVAMRSDMVDIRAFAKPIVGFILFVGCIWLIAVRGIKRAGR